MRNAMVADTLLHAETMITWLGLNVRKWDPVAYFDELHYSYAEAILIMPISGVQEQHGIWVASTLRPRVTGSIGTNTDLWLGADEFGFDDNGAPQLAEPLWPMP